VIVDIGPDFHDLFVTICFVVSDIGFLWNKGCECNVLIEVVETGLNRASNLSLVVPNPSFSVLFSPQS